MCTACRQRSRHQGYAANGRDKKIPVWGELTFWWEKQAANKIIKKILYMWQNLKYFRLCGPCSLCHNYSICFRSTKAATEEIHNEWAWLGADKR